VILKKVAIFTVIFSFALANIPKTVAQFTLDVTLETDKTLYMQMELVNITGNVSFQNELVEDGLIGIQIENPLNQTIMLRTLPLATETSGGFTIEISSIIFCDQYGRPIPPTTQKDKYVWISMTVENKGVTTRTVHASITIVDSNLMPLDIGRASFTIPPGKTAQFVPRMYIPNWATLGTAFAYANAYSKYPKDGGYPLCPEKSLQFDIIESTANPPPAEPTQNGTYELNFRLPSHMPSGIYQVTSAAWYIGYTGFSSKTFETIKLGDINEDGVVDIYDVTAVCIAYGSKEGDSNWYSKADLVKDGVIDVYDLTAVCLLYEG